MASDKNNRLQELGESKFEIADGQPDIRGWDVKDINGKLLGEVDELIFDVESRKVRYIVLDLEDNEWDLKERDVLIPIGLAELHEKDDDVILRDVTIEQLRALPEYDDDDLNTDFESTIRNIFSGTSVASAALASQTNNESDFYAHEHFNNNLNRNRSSIASTDEHVRMRQEPSFLEREGSNRREIDDDVDGLRDERIEMEERDAIPVSNSPTIRDGNDIDERDITDEDTRIRNNTINRNDLLNNNEENNRYPNG